MFAENKESYSEMLPPLKLTDCKLSQNFVTFLQLPFRTKPNVLRDTFFFLVKSKSLLKQINFRDGVIAKPDIDTNSGRWGTSDAEN